MKKMTVILICGATLALAACGENTATRATTGAATGAVVGGAPGAVVGAALGGTGAVQVE
ncbi:hypothetical protein [Paracoccus sediminicola]|uniref:hypothetical protein n=1 Tax=Paracoccus sediminicola TaxID=3017783 RepID=UPI0022F1328D|nr:hypothetical protein [Paracoccus sediminicola]WBU56855.1 hypothetical protein PAF18_15520 [Paracoccus sediminicola]